MVTRIVLVVGVALAALFSVYALLSGGRPVEQDTAPSRAITPEEPPLTRRVESDPAPKVVATEENVMIPRLPKGDENRHPVDLESLQDELPDNLYWMLGLPTEDGEVLERRKDWNARIETLKGRVVSGTANEDEIEEYFAKRERRSKDFVAFATRVLQRYQDELPEQELGLYGLSARMHTTRLEELPSEKERAYERKALQDKRRREWNEGR